MQHSRSPPVCIANQEQKPQRRTNNPPPRRHIPGDAVPPALSRLPRTPRAPRLSSRRQPAAPGPPSSWPCARPRTRPPAWRPCRPARPARPPAPSPGWSRASPTSSLRWHSRQAAPTASPAAPPSPRPSRECMSHGGSEARCWQLVSAALQSPPHCPHALQDRGRRRRQLLGARAVVPGAQDTHSTRGWCRPGVPHPCRACSHTAAGGYTRLSQRSDSTPPGGLDGRGERVKATVKTKGWGERVAVGGEEETCTKRVSRLPVASPHIALPCAAQGRHQPASVRARRGLPSAQQRRPRR